MYRLKSDQKNGDITKVHKSKTRFKIDVFVRAGACGALPTLLIYRTYPDVF